MSTGGRRRTRGGKQRRELPADRVAARPGGAGAHLSIGALARATGVPASTIRTWERRYGFPVAQRKPSGHRVYVIDSVPRIRRIAELLARGVRIGDAVAASDEQLAALLEVDVAGVPAAVAHFDRDQLLDAVTRFDGRAIRRQLTIAWGQLGVLGFVRDCVAPLVVEVGDRWADGLLSIRHEHFLSEQLEDVLRALRTPLDDRATGPVLALATLPGERHALGLHMVALLLNSAGCRVIAGGTDLPADEIVALAQRRRVRAVALSISAAGQGAATTRTVRQLRRGLAPEIDLVVGGAGAPRTLAGVRVLPTLDAAHQWAREIAGTPGRGRS